MDAFHTLAEIAVAITGFSSLIIIFRGSSTDWSRQDYLGFGYVLSWSIGSIFLSLLPVVLVEFGVTLATAARIGLFGTPAYMLAVGGILGYARNRAARELEGRSLPVLKSAMGPGTAGIAMSLSALLIVTVALTAGLELLSGPTHAWFVAVIVLLMAHAIAEMGVFIVLGARESVSESVVGSEDAETD